MRRFLALLATVAGCYEPDVGDEYVRFGDAGDGPAVIGSCSNVDSDLAVPVSFGKDIRPLQLRSPGGCLTCHGTRATAGLDQSSYTSLRRGGVNSGTRIVIPGDPCGSILYQKLGRTPPFGSRMPFSPPYWTVEERQLVHDWIAEGALNN